MVTQRLDDPGPVHDIGVRCIGEQLFDIISTKGAIALAKHDEIGVGESNGLAEAAIDAAKVVLGTTEEMETRE